MENRFETFTVLIAKASRCIYKIKTDEMSEYNLKSSHVSCLYYLYKCGAMTAKELCDMCGEDKANISRAIKFLESKSYIECETANGKRYQSLLNLTDSGKLIGLTISNKIDAVLMEASIGLSAKDREVFYKSLASICLNLENIIKKTDKRRTYD